MATQARTFFSPQEKEDIQMAIRNAELDTSGEIRVHIENSCAGDVMDRAAWIFKKLDMHKTHLRNGVLIYLALRNRKFAIIGDLGINNLVPENFWEDIKAEMLNHFRQNQFGEGLIKAIGMTGTQLKKHFPYKTDDINELPDEISFGNE
jgi:uncharacterized membrane protein